MTCSYGGKAIGPYLVLNSVESGSFPFQKTESPCRPISMPPLVYLPALVIALHRSKQIVDRLLMNQKLCQVTTTCVAGRTILASRWPSVLITEILSGAISTSAARK